MGHRKDADDRYFVCPCTFMNTTAGSGTGLQVLVMDVDAVCILLLSCLVKIVLVLSQRACMI